MEIIYFKTSNSSFVLTDKHILEEYFTVRTYHINNSDGLHYIIALFKLFIFLIWKGSHAKVYFIRFADWHTALIAFFKIIYRRKLVIVVGGFDAFHLPEYGYGVYNSKFRGWCARFALRNATLILPNSPCLIDYTNYYASSVPLRGGIKYFEPKIYGEIKVLFNGFQTDYWAIDSNQVKKNIVMTVAVVNNMKTYRLKGIDSFVELASIMPGIQFKIVGLNKKFLENHNIILPENIEIIELLPHKDLLAHYATAKVFCLFSLTEGMPNVLCEAMLCECIPVGSNVTIIPEIIGDAGFLVYHKDTVEMKRQIELALLSDRSMGKKARQRIIDNYSLETRKKSLFQIVKGLLNEK